MVAPDPELAPLMLPVLVPKVHANVLGVVAVRPMFGPKPLHILAVVAVVTAGRGSTATVMFELKPTQDAAMEVGVMI